jgi:isoleucyl-tRNA synthetase
LPDRVYESDFDYGKIYIDAEITEEIKAEGFARELIRRTQEMRKHMDLEIEDYIECNMLLSTSLKGLLGKKREYIANETRAKKLNLSSTAEATGARVEEWNIEGERVKIGITRLKNN